MYKSTKMTLALAGAMIFSSLGSTLAYADIVINGSVITDASIRDPQNAQAVMDYIKNNPGAAAQLLKNNPTTLEAVCSVYKKSLSDCQKIVDDTLVTTPSQDTVVVGNQAYTNEWITRNKENMDAVVKYITDHPSEAATILQNASQATRDAVLKAVNNGKTGSSVLTTEQANQWINNNTTTPTAIYSSTSQALGSNNYPDIYNKIRTGDLTIGTRIGDTITLSNQQVRDFFAANPTPQDLIKYAAERRMTTSQVAQALTIGRGIAYDPGAMLNYIRDYPGYALGPDNIIVKLQAGQTKRARDGMLEGTWSSDPGHVSYTEWARAWYCAGNGDVNGGKVDYGHGATTQQCDTKSTTTPTPTPTPTVPTTTVGSNPYKSTLSTAAQTKIGTWINTNIVARSMTLTPTNYSKFLETVISKLNTLKSNTPAKNKNKLNTIGYLVYELQQIQNSIDDNDSFLDELLNN